MPSHVKKKVDNDHMTIEINFWKVTPTLERYIHPPHGFASDCSDYAPTPDDLNSFFRLRRGHEGYEKRLKGSSSVSVQQQ